MTERITHSCPLTGLSDHTPAQRGSLVIGCFHGMPHLDGTVFRVMSIQESDDGLLYTLIDPANGATIVRNVSGRWISPVTLTWRQFHNKPPWGPRHQIAELRGLRAQVASNEDGTWHYVVAPITTHNPVAKGCFSTGQEAKEHAQTELLNLELRNASRASRVAIVISED